MTRLVQELTNEHQSIINNLDKIRTLGVTSSEGQKQLQLAKSGLLAHLQKEDSQLYPTLKKASLESDSLARTLEMFGSDMDSISSAALAFFEKYSNGGTGLEFAQDFGTLIATLKMRIKKEESVIYRKYNEVA